MYKLIAYVYHKYASQWNNNKQYVDIHQHAFPYKIWLTTTLQIIVNNTN